jgi:zinc transport system substrate-binding protein
MQTSSRIAAATALIFGLSVLTYAHASPTVLATIKPIHSLVAAVMKGVDRPELLIQGAQSEHSYALKPSDADKIGRARIVFEVGPDLETYLVRPLTTLAPKAKIVALERAPGVRLLQARRGGLWESGDDPNEGPTDPHIWLDPENAIAMTRAIAAALTGVDPAHAAAYATNRDHEVARISATEARLRTALSPLRGRSYLVFHDAYRYFEHRFDLTAVGAVTVAPERPVGPRRIEMLRANILNSKIACVFREPQFSPRLIDTLVAGSPVKTGILDPLGATLAPGPDLYQNLLQGLSDSLTECLR